MELPIQNWEKQETLKKTQPPKTAKKPQAKQKPEKKCWGFWETLWEGWGWNQQTLKTR